MIVLIPEIDVVFPIGIILLLVEFISLALVVVF